MCDAEYRHVVSCFGSNLVQSGRQALDQGAQRFWCEASSIKRPSCSLWTQNPHQHSSASPTESSTPSTTSLTPKTNSFNPTPFKMQFTKIASVLAMAAAAIAAPAPGNYEVEPRTGGGNNQPVCSAQSQQVCCTGLLNCVVQVLGSSCETKSYCCKTDAPVVSSPEKKAE